MSDAHPERSPDSTLAARRPGRGWRLAPVACRNSEEVVPGGERAPATLRAQRGSLGAGNSTPVGCALLSGPGEGGGCSS